MNIIPYPNLCKNLNENFLIPEGVTINYSRRFAPAARLFYDFLKTITGRQPEQSMYAKINITLDVSLEDEQYVLNVDPAAVHIASRTNRGVFYALQTLRQIVFLKEGRYYIPGVFIDDRPRFPYRGLMLDTTHHFFIKEEIYRIIDIISFHKLNVLHLHLTDDNAWRPESAMYPLLNSVSIPGRPGTQESAGGGFYKKSDLTDIVAYAKTKYVDVIPGLCVPAHTRALLAAYPNLSCRSQNDDKHPLLCAGNDLVYEVMGDILNEIIPLFESKYFHLGGHDIFLKRWKKCPLCQKRLKERNKKNEKALAVEFLNYFCELALSHNKIPVVWDDNIKGVMPGAVCQHYKPRMKNVVNKEINNGRKTIVSNARFMSFDRPYADITLKKAYEFEPIKARDGAKENIIGIEAVLWTKWISGRYKLDYQMFPRLAATAETAWTEKDYKCYDNFTERLSAMYDHYQKMGINFGKKKEMAPGPVRRAGQYLKWLRDKNYELKK